MEAIPQKYKGHEFRSMLEVKWASWFDRVEIMWQYEPEGFKLSGGVWYLPDFYLPKLDIFFEVKGILTCPDENKITKLAAESGKPVLLGNASGEVLYYDCEVPGCPVVADEAGCASCVACGHYGFVSLSGDWTCRYCGSNEGFFGESECVPFWNEFSTIEKRENV